MRKSTKIWLITAASLVIVGLIMFVYVLSECGWNFSKLSTGKYENNTYEINEEFGSISIDTDTADIIFIFADDEKCRVECYEEEKSKHSVMVKGDTLVIGMINNKSWYDYIGINFGTPKITVFLSENEYNKLTIKGHTGDIELTEDFMFESIDVTLSTGDVECHTSAQGPVKIRTSTGNIRIENISAESLDLSASTGSVTVSDVICGNEVKIRVSTGKTNLGNIVCKNLISNGSTGNITLDNVIASETFSIKRSTGDVKFESSDAAEIFVETDTGDVFGSLLTDKVYVTHTDTGKVNVPKTVTGGKCEITTDTGNIKLEIK